MINRTITLNGPLDPPGASFEGQWSLLKLGAVVVSSLAPGSFQMSLLRRHQFTYCLWLWWLQLLAAAVVIHGLCLASGCGLQYIHDPYAKETNQAETWSTNVSTWRVTWPKHFQTRYLPWSKLARPKLIEWWSRHSFCTLDSAQSESWKWHSICTECYKRDGTWPGRADHPLVLWYLYSDRLIVSRFCIICLVSQIYHGSTPNHGTGKACYILNFNL